MWSSYLREFMEQYEYPAACVQPLVEAAEKLQDNTAFRKALAAYENGSVQTRSEFLDVLTELREDPACNYTTELLLFMLCTRALKVRYHEAGLPMASYDGVARDLRSKLQECWDVKGIWGSFVASWFIAFFTLDRLVFGRLQYELIAMPACISFDGKLCFNGETAVNIHIPSGRPLLQEEVRASMQEAAHFYADRFPDGSVLFTCHSWLLFPGHYRMLPETSGIRRFMDEFTIVNAGISEEGHDLWRIFNTFDTAELSSLPQDTSLQRAYVKWLREGHPVGVGLGIRRIACV